MKDRLEYDSDRNQCITARNQLLVTLRFYATGSFQLVVADTFHIDKSTVCRIVHRVTQVIASLRPQYVKFPASDQERNDVMQAFFQTSGLPGIVGAVDCTHVAIQSPGCDSAEIYRNRKGHFSINVQLVCDCSGFVTDVVSRWAGSVHDSTIFDNCHLRARFETGELKGCLVGDSGYACRPYLLTPVGNPTTPAEAAYNNAHATARNCIERANGILKRRFPVLKYGIRLHVDNTLPVIVAAVVLHNIALTVGDDEPGDDQQLAEYMATRRQELLADDDYDEEEVQPPDVTNLPGACGMRRVIINNYF